MTTKKPRLSDAGAKVLRNLADGRPACIGFVGRSASGGLSGTLVALRRHGWTGSDGEITDAGREALAAYEARQRGDRFAAGFKAAYGLTR